jgi:hypothetical protein
VLEAVDAVPLAPVVAASAVSRESTSEIVTKLISDGPSTVDVTVVVISVFDVEISVAVSMLPSVSR